METLLQLLEELHDDIDFRQEDGLLTNHLLDSFGQPDFSNPGNLWCKNSCLGNPTRAF